MLAHVGDELFLRRRNAGGPDDVRASELTSHGVWYGSGRNHGDAGVRREHALDLGGVHVVAAGDDHVFAAINHKDVTGLGHGRDVAGVQPAIGLDRLGRRLGIAVVAEHDEQHMIVVTGATGHLGHLVVEGLLEKLPADQVAAVVRSPQKAADLAERGVTVRKADYNQPETLASALEGADKVLLVSSNNLGKRVPQHRAVIEAAREADVAHLVYTSVPKADTSPLVLAPDHKATERSSPRPA